MDKKKWMKIVLAIAFLLAFKGLLSGRTTYYSVRVGDYRDRDW